MKKEDILALPEIPRKEVRWLWHSNYWDGVLSGMLLYKGKKYWFVCCDEAGDYVDYDEEKDLTASEQLGWYRRYAIIRITDEQVSRAEYWLHLFEKYVAVYSTYDENEKPLGQDFPDYVDRGIPVHRGARDPKWHDLYYKMTRNTEEVFPEYGLDDGVIIGWFQD